VQQRPRPPPPATTTTTAASATLVAAATATAESQSHPELFRNGKRIISGHRSLHAGSLVRKLMAGSIQLQKSPSAPPLKRQHHGSGCDQHSGITGRPAFEFPAPPSPPPHGTSSAGSSGRAMGLNLRHRSDEGLSGIGSSMWLI
jgi:hypothetical protein